MSINQQTKMVHGGIDIIVHEGRMPKNSDVVNPVRVRLYADIALNLYDSLIQGNTACANDYISNFRKVDHHTRAEVYKYLIRTSLAYRKMGIKFQGDLYRDAAINFRKQFLHDITKKFERFTVHKGGKKLK